MRNNRGAIAVFTLLAMLFFLIFVMVGYSNIASKNQSQVETTGVLEDEYKSDTNSSVLLNSIMTGNVTTNETRTAEENAVLNKSGNYIAIDGKIYKIP